MSCQAQVGVWKQIEVKGHDVERGPLLSKGVYAEVYEGRVFGSACALKLYRTTASRRQMQNVMQEVKLIASLDHPCTLRILGWVREPLQIITELCRGDLEAFYKEKIELVPYSEWDAFRLLRVGFAL